MMSRLTFSHRSERLCALIDDRKAERLTIPPYQRGYCWSEARQEAFIDSIFCGMPCPSVLLGKQDADLYPTLEDGQQRITTAQRYRDNMFACKGVLYKDHTDIERFRFDNYQVAITQHNNANEWERIEIFDRHQNGLPLSTGERYHAMETFSPIVRYTKEKLLTQDSGFHDRSTPFWGTRSGGGPRMTFLKTQVALILGLAFGPANMTEKYEFVRSKKFLSRAFDEVAVTKDLVRVLEIYEEAERQLPCTAAKYKNVLFNPGSFTGYIVSSLSYKLRIVDGQTFTPNSLETNPAEWQRLKNGWVAFLIATRRNNALLDDKLRQDVQDIGRAWTHRRWDLGYLRVFEPTSPRIGELLGYAASEASSDFEDDE